YKVYLMGNGTVIFEADTVLAAEGNATVLKPFETYNFSVFGLDPESQYGIYITADVPASDNQMHSFQLQTAYLTTTDVDLTPPLWVYTYPSVGSIEAVAARLEAGINEPGLVFYAVALASSSSAELETVPSVVDCAAGYFLCDKIAVAEGYEAVWADITGLTSESEHVACFVAEDEGGYQCGNQGGSFIANRQNATVCRSFSTLDNTPPNCTCGAGSSPTSAPAVSAVTQEGFALLVQPGEGGHAQFLVVNASIAAQVTDADVFDWLRSNELLVEPAELRAAEGASPSGALEGFAAPASGNASYDSACSPLPLAVRGLAPGTAYTVFVGVQDTALPAANWQLCAAVNVTTTALSPPPPLPPPPQPQPPPPLPPPPYSCDNRSSFTARARPVISLQTSAPGFALSPSTSPSASPDGTFSRSFGFFNSRSLGSPGRAVVTLGGSALAGGTSAIFRSSPKPVVAMAAIVQTVRVYVDRSQMYVRCQVRDAEGRVVVDKSALAIVALVSLDATGEEREVTCGNVGSDGTSTCSFELAADWFSTSSSRTATVWTEARYSGTAVVRTEDVTVALDRAAVQSTLSGAGMRMAVPQGPQWVAEQVPLSSASKAGEEFSLVITANTGGRALAGWRITVSYNAELVEYRSLTQFDQLWSTATDEGQVTIVVSSISSQASPADLKGDEVDIVRVNVRARNVAGAGLQPAPGNTSIFTDVFQLEVLDMNDDANSEFVNDEDGLVVDMRDGGTASGSLGLRSMAVAGVYGYPRTPTDLANSAPLTSSGSCSRTTCTLPLTSRSVNTRDITTVDISSQSTCTPVGAAAASVLSVSSCQATAGASHTRGASVTVQSSVTSVEYGSFSALIPLVVWYPQAVSVTPEDFTLDRIDGLHRADACGMPVYQSTPLSASCTWGGTGLPNVTGLDVTPLVTFTTSQPGVARVDEAALQGVAAGSTSVGLQASFAALQPATVQVVNGTVRVTMLEAVAVSGVDFGDWTPDNSPSIDPAEAEATAHVELLQELLKEADSASVVVYATFSDGTVADVTDEPDIEVTSLYPDSLNITQEPWGVYVPFQGTSRSGTLLRVQWSRPAECGGGMVSAGDGCATVELPAPVSATCTATQSRITRPVDAAAACPANVATTSSMTVRLTFDDGTSADYTVDPRTEYRMLLGAELVTVDKGSSSVVAQVWENSTSGTGAATVEAYFPVFGNPSLTCQVQISVVEASAVAVVNTYHFDPSQTSSTNPLLELKVVECTPSQWQQAYIKMQLTLSDGVIVDVTRHASYTSSNPAVIEVGETATSSTSCGRRPNQYLLIAASVGASDIQGTFEGLQSAAWAMTVTADEATTTALTWTTSWSTDTTFAELQGSSKTLRARATFADGTRAQRVAST
ncbi:hypothetical protein CYMTET_20033, partial [Cymbomonas tetramitiformis]